MALKRGRACTSPDGLVSCSHREDHGDSDSDSDGDSDEHPDRDTDKHSDRDYYCNSYVDPDQYSNRDAD
jgi:hypothetical protein